MPNYVLNANPPRVSAMDLSVGVSLDNIISSFEMCPIEAEAPKIE